MAVGLGDGVWTGIIVGVTAGVTVAVGSGVPTVCIAVASGSAVAAIGVSVGLTAVGAGVNEWVGTDASVIADGVWADSAVGTAIVPGVGMVCGWSVWLTRCSASVISAPDSVRKFSETRLSSTVSSPSARKPMLTLAFGWRVVLYSMGVMR